MTLKLNNSKRHTVLAGVAALRAETLSRADAVPIAGGMTSERMPTEPVPEPVLRLHKDETGVIRHVDETTVRTLGWTAEEMVGHRSLEFIHPRDHDKLLGGWVRLLGRPGARERTRIRHCDASGRWLWFDVVNHNLLHHPTSPVVLTEMVPVGDVADSEGDWYTSH